jgi:ABC-type transporter Mla subunit MlaD
LTEAPPHRTGAGPILVAFAALAAVLLVACEEPRASIRPSPSLIEIDFSPPPTPGPELTDEPTIEPTFVALPVGWDNTFCGVLADAVVAQELVIDIERAVDEEAFRDARGLARDLRDITADATTLLAELPAWDPAADATQRIAALIDLGARAGEQYGIAFTEDSTSALRRARNLRRDMSRATPAANEALAGLTDLGIACEGTPMQLETF